MNLKVKKERLDTILVERGFFETKSQAQAAIMAGKVRIDNKPVTKAGTQIAPDASLNVEIDNLPYVSRGGLKLEKALKIFNISVENKICLDAGASTGGFTDCMLQNGAEKVYAVDVGYGQLAWKLRNDPRVTVIERTNIRHASIEEIYKDVTNKEEFAEFAAMDLSFISITKVLSNIKTLMHPNKQEIVALIKPQFEAGRDQVPKSGVIKDKNVHLNVIKYVIDFACTLSLFPVDLTYSPVKGPAGNIEYLVYLSNEQGNMNEEKIRMVVDEAYEQLSSG